MSSPLNDLPYDLKVQLLSSLQAPALAALLQTSSSFFSVYKAQEYSILLGSLLASTAQHNWTHSALLLGACYSGAFSSKGVPGGFCPRRGDRKTLEELELEIYAFSAIERWTLHEIKAGFRAHLYASRLADLTLARTKTHLARQLEVETIVDSSGMDSDYHELEQAELLEKLLTPHLYDQHLHMAYHTLLSGILIKIEPPNTSSGFRTFQIIPDSILPLPNPSLKGSEDSRLSRLYELEDIGWPPGHIFYQWHVHDTAFRAVFESGLRSMANLHKSTAEIIKSIWKNDAKDYTQFHEPWRLTFVYTSMMHRSCSPDTVLSNSRSMTFAVNLLRELMEEPKRPNTELGEGHPMQETRSFQRRVANDMAINWNYLYALGLATTFRAREKILEEWIRGVFCSEEAIAFTKSAARWEAPNWEEERRFYGCGIWNHETAYISRVPAWERAWWQDEIWFEERGEGMVEWVLLGAKNDEEINIWHPISLDGY